MKKNSERTAKRCPLCTSVRYKVAYQTQVPVFQHKVYESVGAAKKAKLGKVDLAVCQGCGFVFNFAFDASLMDYDKKYQNEQGNSEYFKDYLQSVVKLIKKSVTKKEKVVEVGCGKGLFLELMRTHGLTVKGFDPTYEGNDKDIIKEYFSEHSAIQADLIVLRHTLEHIESPFEFLQMIARANGNRGKIFVEVPSFDWITKKEAFWDIFHEHCNYFTSRSLASMFKKSKTGDLFGGQYIYVLADLRDIQSEVVSAPRAVISKILAEARRVSATITRHASFVEKNKPIVIWGAGAKGSTFANLLDTDRSCISYVIDKNPKKQNKRIAGSGHLVLSPEEGIRKLQSQTIVVMNENYLAEIKKDVARMSQKRPRIVTLGLDI